MTPWAFHGLLKRHRNATENRELLMGILAATVANTSMRGPEKACVPADFMPSQFGKPEAEPTEEQRATPEQTHNFMAMLANRVGKGSTDAI